MTNTSLTSSQLENRDPLVKPVLKWVGGKRQLLNEILPLVPPDPSCYIEPFLGGGAVAFALQPKKAILNDFNGELINVYLSVRDNADDLLLLLKEHEAKNSADYFYSIRALDRDSEYEKLSSVERAARVVYLNKTCYNGLYRVNTSGQFNTPYGKYKNPLIVEEVTIRAVANYLQNNDITLTQGDYAQALQGAQEGEFVYLDPPYIPLSTTSDFTGYTQSGFGYDEHLRLKAQCDELISKGVHFLQSNSNSEATRELYSEQRFQLKIVKANRAINSKGNGRAQVEEVIISG